MAKRFPREVSLPEMLLVAGTRALLGGGLGLLLADRLDPRVRRGLGWTLVAIGVGSTIPLGLEVFGGAKRRESGPRETPFAASGFEPGASI